jgi:6-pyruvoyltetrahydropterin/6-carboxytetrahydropterin synthase
MYEITVNTVISASHHLRNYTGKCENQHGHNWKIEATVRCSALDQVGLAMDFGLLRRQLTEVCEEFDHTDLNTHEAFLTQNPSSENLARVIFDRLRTALARAPVVVSRIRVWETEGSAASYSDDDCSSNA